MKRTIAFAFLAALFLLTLVSASEPRAFNGYIVRMERERPALFSAGEDSGFDYVAPKLYKVGDGELVKELLASGEAESAEPNYIIELFDVELAAVDTNVSWSDVLVKADYAANLGLDGTGVRVAVIDSGLNAENGNLQNANIAAGYDYVDDSAEQMSDGLGHGTNVTQMIVGDGEGRAVKGIAPEATIVPLRCFNDEGTAETADLLQALYDAVDIYDCDVINISWGFNSGSTELLNAVKHVSDAGAIAVGAVGNVNEDTPQGTVVYPAAYEQVVGVGAVDSSLAVTSFSVQTEAVYACAPGEWTIFVGNSGSLIQSRGTSFAAPCVSAMAALLRQMVPTLSVAALRALIAERAVDLGTAGYDTAYGHGFVQMDELLGKSWMYDMGMQAIGWLRNDGSALVKATYSEEGRMESCTVTSTAQEIAAIAQGFPAGESASLFLWDKDYVPLVAAIRRE